MRNRRSYIDQVNAGRERRQHAPYGDINRTLQGLEERLESLAGSTAGIDRAMRQDMADRVPRRPAPPKPQPSKASRAMKSLEEIAREIERARSGPRAADMIQSLTGEIRDLKSNLRKEMAAGLKAEFDVLRRDIEKTYVAAMGSNNGAEISDELDRIGATIRDLSARQVDNGADSLRGDIDELRRSVEGLAREDTLRAVDGRWGDLDRRFDGFEERLANIAPGVDYSEYLDRLYGQLEQVASAIDHLPSNIPIRDLEERVETLAEAIENLSIPSGGVEPSAISQIEDRLDAISHAIASAPVPQEPAAFDYEPIERIESRLAALTSKMEGMSIDRDDDIIVDRINMLAERIENLAASGDRQPQPSELDYDLHGRLTAIAERLDAAVPNEESTVRQIEERLQQIVAQFEDAASSVSVAPAAAPAGLEERLDEIVRRLDEAPRAAPEYDDDLVRRMESHLAALSEQISTASHGDGSQESYRQPAAELDRETILETARMAAIEAVGAMPQGSADTHLLDALAGDLKELEHLAKRSEERNSKTFEAIHDTLLKIVDRLGTLEESRQAPVPANTAATDYPTAPVMPEAEIPSLDDGVGDPLVPATPASAAAAAALAAERASKQFEMHTATADEEGAEADKSKSMFGGLARRMSRKRAAAEETGPRLPEEPAVPELSKDPEIDAELADQPLEPGSGAPDISAIMKRVQEEREGPEKAKDSKTAQADFIAAARRAAQAAAAEAAIMKSGDDTESAKSAKPGSSLLQNKRKAILMGATAIMVLLAGYQLGSAFLGGEKQTAQNDVPAPVVGEDSLEPMETETAQSEDKIIEEPLADPTANVRVVEPANPDAMAEATPSTEDMITEPAVETAESQSTSMLSDPQSVAAAQPVETQSVETVAAESYSPPPASIGPEPLRNAAVAGDQIAMFEIGARFAEGRGTKQDLKKAAEWYERSAKKGFAPAQYRYGNMLEKGIGIERDISAAKSWYQMAAQQGNASAMHNLAVLFAMGAGGEVDNDSAARWFIEAAELGVTDSQFNLGILAAKGVGVPQDLMESYKWFALAGKSGDKDALKKRDEVANAMRPEQLEKARVAAELWKVKPVNPDTNTVTLPDAWTDEGAQATAAVDKVDMKKAVKNIQLLLLKNGFNPGTPDGVMGKKTMDAIKAYQKANGMAVTGAVDETLVRKLLETNS